MSPADILSNIRPDLGPYEKIYKNLHQNPGLSLQEYLAAETAAGHLSMLLFLFERESFLDGGCGRIGLVIGDRERVVFCGADWK